MNLKKIRRLMGKYGLKCPVRKENPYRQMARQLRTSNIAPNLVQRNFHGFGPRKILLTDITYLFYKGGKCYLSTIVITSGEWCLDTSFYHTGSHYGFLFSGVQLHFTIGLAKKEKSCHDDCMSKQFVNRKGKINRRKRSTYRSVGHAACG